MPMVRAQKSHSTTYVDFKIVQMTRVAQEELPMMVERKGRYLKEEKGKKAGGSAETS